ncbi:kinase-associated lipoprotein B [Bacillus carboniphilus]|uniref:Kinase-associated lipoprotein B n=1 Tax=Bacillus carboniphilus TaxID=86663 RepID=A0ABY9JSL9_9BACI|nr:kinase-associated lipoprotein B [Bacillus carboniphilus]WLR41253.1 kinase-associated lipoprotein B [Bacillus carboniphilus]
MRTVKTGDPVTGIYKTGKYIGEITEERPQHYLIKVKAVIKHPTQGDLHNPNKVEVPIFHERRALAENEQTNIPKGMVKPYEGSLPDYKESLKLSLKNQLDELEQKNTPWSRKSKETLLSLKKDYFSKD